MATNQSNLSQTFVLPLMIRSHWRGRFNDTREATVRQNLRCSPNQKSTTSNHWQRSSSKFLNTWHRCTVCRPSNCLRDWWSITTSQLSRWVVYWRHIYMRTKTVSAALHDPRCFRRYKCHQRLWIYNAEIAGHVRRIFPCPGHQVRSAGVRIIISLSYLALLILILF